MLRPDGRLVLLDHVRSTNPAIFVLQRLIELVSVRVDGDRMTRRPSSHLSDHGFDVLEAERFRRGIVERVLAVKRP